MSGRSIWGLIADQAAAVFFGAGILSYTLGQLHDTDLKLPALGYWDCVLTLAALSVVVSVIFASYTVAVANSRRGWNGVNR